MQELSDAGLDVVEGTIENVLIAALFHDTGLTIDTSEKHGRLSRQLCEKFFVQNPDLWNNSLSDALFAIEHHDDKQLKRCDLSEKEYLTTPLSIISTADDLDALGYIGVFRYTEIYLIRGVPLQMLPSKVIENLKNRFTNFENTYPFLDEYIKKQRVRYELTLNFFTTMATHLSANPSLQRNDSKGVGNFQVVNILNHCLVERKLDIMPTIEYALQHSELNIVKQFFIDLKDELHALRPQP
jgi:predicted unusual protein kinase regulating ubiquinone biosynthesis (AarF/ABC1/UbiB family)